VTKTPSESPESSSPIVTRAVAAGLQGAYCDNYLLPTWQRTALLALGSLPQGVARFVIGRVQAGTASPPEDLTDFSIDQLIQTRLSDYAPLTGRFPAIVVGAALGAPSTHLSLALGGPFLPQAYVLTIRGGSLDGDVERYFKRSADPALRIADENPALMTIQHYDPVHDGWLTRRANHLRFKLIDLPQQYAEFIRQRLEPGGAVVYLEGEASWLRYRVGARSVFQVGGWGGIPAEEFLEGSQRLRDYAHRTGLKHTDWHLRGFLLERGPESEWGSEPGLAEALEAFCQSLGYRFMRIPFGEPNDLSNLAFAAMWRLLKKDGRQPSGVLIEMFSQFDATAAWQSGLLPLWLVFNTDDSLEFLQRMRPSFPQGKPVFFSPLVTFSLTPDLVPFAKWAAALEGLEWRNIGARADHYPADARALVTWANPLRSWAAEHAQPLNLRLTAEELAKLGEEIQSIRRNSAPRTPG
jgi:hypothetical protein